MKTTLELNENKLPVVRIEKSLNKYDDVVLFPSKVKKAKEDFEKFGLPDLKKTAAKKNIAIAKKW